MKTHQTSIRRAHPGEAGAIAELIARAFDPLEMTRWLVPNDVDRIPVMTGFLHLTVEHAIVHGTVEVIGDLLGGAVWLPSTAPDIGDYEQRLKDACGVYTERFQALDAAMHAIHPTTPHEYLPFLAVHPDLQTCGLGGALLDHHHTTLDPRDIPAYREAASPDSARLYRRHGYQSINNVFGPAGSNARLRPMWRESTNGSVRKEAVCPEARGPNPNSHQSHYAQTIGAEIPSPTPEGTPLR